MQSPRALITLDEAKDHAQIDNDAGDANVELLVGAASELVLNYLKAGADAFTDSAGDVPVDSNGAPLNVPYAVKAATLFMFAVLYKDKDENKESIFQQGYLPAPVTAMLYPLRDPALK